MRVRQSEFARICGVSAMAVSQRVKKGALVLTEDRRIDTDNEKNRRYLDEHQRKLYALRHEGVPGGRLAVEAQNSRAELGTEVYSSAGRAAVAACRALIQYIEQTEREMAERQGVTMKPVDPACVQFLQGLTDCIVQSERLNNMYTHDALLMSLNSEYRVPYLVALGESKKKKSAGA